MFSQDVWRCLPGVQLAGRAGDIGLRSPRARPRLSSSHHTSWVTKHWSYNRKKEGSQYKETVTKTVMSVLASEADSQTIIVDNYFMK